MRARKRFAQHFLEPAWSRKVVELINPSDDECFLEIGPGRGALTLALAASGAIVAAVEIDRDLVRRLRAVLPDNVTLVEGNILDMDLAQVLPSSERCSTVRVVGNLPYNITSPILARLVDAWRATRRLADATLMVQFEVAERILARPGGRDYGPLAIGLGRWAAVDRLLVLPPGAFRPSPRVRSALIHLRFRASPVPVDDERTFDAMVKALFSRRRKTLANALDPFARTRGRTARQVLRTAGIDGIRRPETLDLAELAALAREVGASAADPVL